MEHKEYNRRDFLKRFAALSSVSVVGLLQACGSNNPDIIPKAAYGPGPVYPYGVKGIYYIDSNSYRVYLNGQDVQNVPLTVPFVIQFSQAMNTTAPATVTFTASGGNAVAFNKVWDDPQNLRVTPTAALAPNTGYTVTMEGDALDAQGYAIGQNANSTATFKTAAA